MARMVSLRTGAAFTVVAVAVFAAVQSFSHIYWIGQTHGQGALDSVLLPLSIDGLILAMTLVLLHEASEDHSGPWLAWCLLWLGIGATIAANVIYGQRFGRVGIGASVWPAIAFVGAVHVVAKVVRSRSTSAKTETAEKPAPAEAEPESPEQTARFAYAASAQAGNPLSERRLAQSYGISRPRAKSIITEMATQVATMDPAGAASPTPPPSRQADAAGAGPQNPPPGSVPAASNGSHGA